MIKLYPSLISGDILNLQEQITLLDPHCDGYHLDLMDGHFVPNITWGPAFINAIATATTKTCWVHLMATNPEQWINHFTLPAGSMVDFHIETSIDHKALLTSIKAKGWRSGIAVSPQTDIEAVFHLIDNIDYILIMSVEPGFSGQAFIPEVIEKINALATYREKYGLRFEIAIDGGINKQNIGEVVKAGVDHIAAAAAIFAENDPVVALQNLKLLLFSV